MSEYLVKRESLIAIADEVRTLSGTTNNLSLSDITTTVNNANVNVATQTDIIAQIAAALEGKAGGGLYITLNNITATYDGAGNLTIK